MNEKTTPTEKIKELRNLSCAGIMDCKKALADANGQLQKALEILQQKGLTSADKKTTRLAKEGLIECYLHTGGKLGAIIEINCETDFVAKQQKFQDLAKNIAMQIAACPAVKYIRTEDIPNEVINLEKNIESSKDDLNKKTEDIKEKIITNRTKKKLAELTLLNQAYIRDPSITVEELIKQHIAILGENIQIRRFQRFELGETQKHN
ncbi:elongation factor Ts (plastid) [Cryptomonas paramecium]|uniref:Elongation factor Ts, mitochondrial n=1 Tax=Cryptomonas paramaecium TaxID=2898 RepID=D2IS76_9CRYP|nr:elongation factor Ts [Cryptomonas paramecium]ACT46768.1 elongation factor Ts [Cryptomonas paramecium]BDA98027.1 elongation factor Ts [Cryptomonas paramecium]